MLLVVFRASVLLLLAVGIRAAPAAEPQLGLLSGFLAPLTREFENLGKLHIKGTLFSNFPLKANLFTKKGIVDAREISVNPPEEIV